MDAVATASSGSAPRSSAAGFSFVEVLVAIGILTAGLLPLVALFTAGVIRITASTPMLVAREKAREAIESVHAARDTGTSFASIANKSKGGVFVDGPAAIRHPGNDGLVNTDDDGALAFPATEFSREIAIVPVKNDGLETENPVLRELRVIVRSKVHGAWREYRIVTYISAYS